MIGSRIKTRRKQLHITQKELGSAIGKGESTISEWESEKRSPDVDLICDIARILHTSPAYLMGWSDNPEEDKLTGEGEMGQHKTRNADLMGYAAYIASSHPGDVRVQLLSIMSRLSTEDWAALARIAHLFLEEAGQVPPSPAKEKADPD